MINVTGPRATDRQDLALRHAKSRVALAALRRKHAGGALSDEEIHQASVLRDYYVQSLRAAERIPLDEAVVPRDDMRQILETVLLTYETTPNPVVDAEVVELLVEHLNRLISRTMSASDAAQLIKLLNSLSGKRPSPQYDPGELLPPLPLK